MKHKIQSGRSMIEMLGVLAIVGVLSVGALAGYSMAMIKYKTNQAINEIKGIIRETMITADEMSLQRDFFYSQNTMENILKDKGVFPSDNVNALGYDISIFANAQTLTLSYYVPNDGVICKKILLAGWDQTFKASNIKWIGASEYGATENFTIFSNTYSSADYPLPITVERAASACPGGWSNTMFSLSITYY